MPRSSASARDSPELSPGAAHERDSSSSSDDSADERDLAIDDHDRDESITTESVRAAAAAAASASGVQSLPSYQQLMSSLQPTQRKAPSKRAKLPASFSLSADAEPDADENSGFIEDAPEADSDSSDEAGDGAAAAAAALSFPSMLARAQHLEKRGLLQKAAHTYLWCLERYRYSHEHQDLIATCLRSLGDICYRNKKYKEALQFRTAERMIFESSLLRVMKTDAATEAANAAAAAVNPAAAAAASSTASSSSASATPGRSSASAILSMRSVEPLPLAVGPIAPKSLLADEERALTYERLAKLFFEEKNMDMCKSYVLKAQAIRREIKAKWGDPATMTPDELLLHQLAVMGREQYEQTSERFRGGGEDDDEAKHSRAEDASAEPKKNDAYTDAMQYSLSRSLQVLASTKSKPTTAAAASASASAPSALRQRSLAPSERKQQVALASPSSPSSSAPSSADSAADSASSHVSSIVKSRPLGLNRRALLTSFLVGVLLLVLAWWLITRTFADVFFPLRHRPADRFGVK